MTAESFSDLLDRPQVVVQAPLRSIAFFDVDRTLLRESSIAIGLRYLSRRPRVGAEEFLRLLVASGLLSLFLQRMPFPMWLRHFPLRYPSLLSVQSICLGWFWNCLIESISPKAVQKIREHQQNGELVMLLSCSSQFVAGFIAQHLGIQYSCTFLRVEDNRLVSEPLVEVCYGLGKFRAAQSISRSWDIPLSRCTFYTDSYSDRSLLESVGCPIVVNPDLGLSLLAIHNRWNVFRF